ncbi:hypothetical protein [Paenibacillus sediminis]|uniref:Uncharacterized protein n=1 Tax=Paenibacillus sediminis TaxID=664909 RepID=A0ABS4H6D2_9BACL|nr:hypothetical protein [Paenibacillus sediminis]MBP1938087.1 hypothetical protein [Paenibacillus sediminis]
MADETELNETMDDTAAQDKNNEWFEQVKNILAPKDPEPMRDYKS